MRSSWMIYLWSALGVGLAFYAVWVAGGFGRGASADKSRPMGRDHDLE